MNIVKFDPKLSTLEGSSMHLTQTQLDDIIRKNAAPHAVDSLVSETQSNQEYRLSNGTILIISKRSGKGRIEHSVFGRLIRRF